MRFQADAIGYQTQDDATSMDIDDAITQLQEALRSSNSETSTASAILQTNAEANTALSDRI
jgi:hypothetical protein